MAGLSSKAANSLINKHKYTNKELQNQEFSDGSGLETYDYGARMLDHQIGRWNVVDPSADNYKSFSPYNFCLNNPLKFIDYDGRDIIVVTSSGNFKLAKETLLKTKAGKELWEKYSKSKTHDIYITIGHISSFNVNARTNFGFTWDPTKFDFSQMIENGKLHYINGVITEEVLLAFEGVDISRSKGRAISFILLNELNFDENNPASEEFNKRKNSVNNFTEIPYNLAEIFYHELKAHVDLGNEHDQHAAYGKQFSGVFLENVLPAPRTHAETIKNQLYSEYLKGFMDDPKDNPHYIPIDPNIANKG